MTSTAEADSPPRPLGTYQWWYFWIFVVLFAPGSGFIVWQEGWRNNADGGPETVRAIIDGVEPVVVASMAITYVIVQGAAMIAESYLRRRYQEGREEGRDETLSALERVAREKGMSVEEIQRIIDDMRAIIRKGSR